MYAIVDIAGQQFKVEKDQKIYVNRLEAKEGSRIDFDKVLLIDDNGKVQVGLPVLKNFVVSASVVSHLKGDKVKVFKKKRRKGYQVLNGHRQALTELLIESIGEGKAKVAATPKKEAGSRAEVIEKSKPPKVAEEKPAVEKKAAIKKTTSGRVKTEKTVTAEKAASKKPAAKAKSTPEKEAKPEVKKASPKAKTTTAPRAKAVTKKEKK